MKEQAYEIKEIMKRLATIGDKLSPQSKETIKRINEELKELVEILSY